MRTNNFPGKTARIVLSLLAAFFIVLNGRWNLIHKALVSPSFYVAVLVSFLIAYLMLTVVHSASVILDKRVPLRVYLWKRIVLQLLLGVVAPCILDVAMAAVYISATGQNFLESGFMIYDFPIIAAFVFFVNGMYMFHHFALRGKDREYDEKDHDDPYSSMIEIRYQGNRKVLDADKEILCFIKESKQISLVKTDGSELTINDTLNSLEERLQRSNLFRINRSTIINLDSIAKVENGRKRNTFDVVLNPPYNDMIGCDRSRFFVVTSDHIRKIGIYFQPD